MRVIERAKETFDRHPKLARVATRSLLALAALQTVACDVIINQNDNPPPTATTIPTSEAAAQTGFCSDGARRVPFSKREEPFVYTVRNTHAGISDDLIRSLHVVREGVLLGYGNERLADSVGFLSPEGFEICGPNVAGLVNALHRNPSTGEIFVVTDGEGTHRFHQGKWDHYNKANLRGLNEHRGYDVVPDGDNTLVATLDGVSQWNLNKDQWSPLRNFSPENTSNKRIHALAVRDDEAFSGMILEGLYDVSRERLYRVETDPKTLVSNNIRSLAFNHDGSRLWIAADPGLSWLDPKTGASEIITLPTPDANRVMKVTFDPSNRPWVATFGGTFYHDGTDWKQYDPRKAFSVGFGCAGCAYDEKKLFIATAGRGLVQGIVP